MLSLVHSSSSGRYRLVIDCHMHVRAGKAGELDVAICDAIIEAGDLLGIDQFCICDLQLTGPLKYDDFHRANERVAAAILRHPTKLKGYCFVNPGDERAMEEITQRVRDEGFIGVKLYNQYTLDDPVAAPILERALEWQVPVLAHAGRLMDPTSRQLQPYISDASRFITVARRYPGLILIHAHLGGGGDWEWTLKTLRDAPTVYLDTSGSVVDEWMIDRAVQLLGVDRLLFGTDMTMEGGVGKILDANLTDEQRRQILGTNMQTLLGKRAVR